MQDSTGPHKGHRRKEQVGTSAQIFLSQNFLRSRQLVDYLLQSSSIGPEDTVYEIGPGRGIITERLARRCREVIAVERDHALVEHLRSAFEDLPNVLILEGDFLAHELPRTPYKVFSNIPFSITAAIVDKLTSAPNPPKDTYLIMQREAAERFSGVPRASLAAVLLRPWFEPYILHSFRREDFHPHPGVDVVLLRLRLREDILIQPEHSQLYRDFVTHGFSAWQPSLHPTLASIFGARGYARVAKTLGIEQDAIPTSLSFEQWLELFHAYLLLGDPRAKRLFEGAADRLRVQQSSLQKKYRTRKQMDRGLRWKEGG